MFTQNDINNLLNIIGIGRANALTATQIAGALGFPIGGNQVRTRKLISFAIQNGHLIKSSTANPPGYWLSNNRTEINNYITSLRQRAHEITNRANNLQQNWNNSNPNNPI